MLSYDSPHGPLFNTPLQELEYAAAVYHYLPVFHYLILRNITIDCISEHALLTEDLSIQK